MILRDLLMDREPVSHWQACYNVNVGVLIVNRTRLEVSRKIGVNMIFSWFIKLHTVFDYIRWLVYPVN